jgi:hypothetical protein
VVVLAVLAVVGMSVSMRSAFDDAADDRQALALRFDGVEGYTPDVDGVVARERVERFLAVREAISSVEGDFEALDDEAAEFEALGEDGRPPMRVALPAVVRMTRAMIGMPWLLGDLERTRNRALLDVDMGLGEYVYIYCVAYHGRELVPGTTSMLSDSKAINGRIRRELRLMIRRQLAAARSELAENDPWRERLAAEVEALDEDPSRIPWQDGLPPAIEASLAPFRDRLDAMYSAPAAEFELLNSSIEAGGLRISME